MKKLVKQFRTFSMRWAALLLLLCVSAQAVFAEENAKILVVKSKGIDSYNLAVEGFREQVSPKWVFAEYDLGGIVNNENRNQLAKSLETEKPDLVVAVGAKAAAALTQSKVSCPVVFCMVMSSEKHLLQGPNITGISLTTSPEEQLKVLISLSPKIKRVGVLLRKEASSDLLKNVTELAQKYKVRLIPIEFENEKSIPHSLRPALSQVDALWMLDDAYIHSKDSLQFVILNAIENNLPFMANSKVFVKEGALISLSSSFFRNGKQAAEMAKIILTDKVSPKDIPISFHKDPDLTINLKIARKIGLTIPPAILDKAEVYE